MPQDSVTVDGNTVTYPGNYDSLPADVQYIMDSVSGTLPVYNERDFDNQSDSYSHWALPITIALFAGTWFLLKFLNKNPFHLKLDDDSQPPADNETAGESAEEPCLTYEGSSLGLSAEDITTILEKRFSFYTDLNADEQNRFFVRHKKFMSSKVFMIHDKKSFREMPVLVSAAAIQLSFGLQNYMLESYPYVNIFPQEFVRADSNGICFLEGNVSGNSINISWKHFLEGYRMPDDGDNVGLHEMAHAYYTQNMESDEGSNGCFVRAFPAFTAAGTKAFETEKISAMPFYSKYAQRNFQEFWAESVERFFERGGELKNTYPDVYAALCVLLNQSPMA